MLPILSRTAPETDVLASWNDGLTRRAIVDFVTAATEPGGGFIPAADRIATFDNDGTLWVEQPMPPQFDFVFRKWAEEIKADPSLAASSRTRRSSKRTRRSFRAWRPRTQRSSRPSSRGSLVLGRVRRRKSSTRKSRVVRDGQAAGPRRAVRQARLQADARAAPVPHRARVPGVCVLRWRAATSCGSSPSRPGGSTRRT